MGVMNLTPDSFSDGGFIHGVDQAVRRAGLLLGPSRKRFTGAVLNEPRPRARLWGAATVCALAGGQGVGVLRVHDVGL